MVLFLLCVVISVAFLLGPPSWGTATAGAVRGTVLVPFLWLQLRAEEARTSRARFVAVEGQRDSAAWAAQAVPALRAENDRLRALLGISARVEMPYHPAEVLRQSQTTDGRTMILSIGASSGVEPFDPVVSPEGLVGVVLTVDRGTSVMMTWVHPDFRVSAATEDGSVLGVVAPAEAGNESEPLLELRGVPYNDTVPVGTVVVTTGLGGIYPRGIPIGRVIDVAREQKGWERIYLVRPATNLGTTTHMLVLDPPIAVRSVLVPQAEPPTPVDTVRPAPRRRPRPVVPDTARAPDTVRAADTATRTP
jgi:rod shape-determining protein MreC